MVPNQPITLHPAQIEELNKKLSMTRHDINGATTVVLLSAEMMRIAPETAEARYRVVADQVEKIGACLKVFSREFEAALGITRDKTAPPDLNKPAL